MTYYPQCSKKRGSEAITERVFVPGVLEADELCERMIRHAEYPHRCPTDEDRVNVLTIGKNLVCFGDIVSAEVLDNDHYGDKPPFGVHSSDSNSSSSASSKKKKKKKSSEKRRLLE